MENFLYVRCPRCGGADQIDIAATVWVRLTEYGTDADASAIGGHEYTPSSTAACSACGYRGRLDSYTDDRETG